MFEQCSSLAELNAERTKAIQNKMDVVTVNNAYNERRKEILASRCNFLKLKEFRIITKPVQTYSGLPIAGASRIPNTIELTQKGIFV